VSDDWRVTGRSDEEVRAIAERTKSECGVARLRPVNVLRILKSGSIPTLYGRKKLVFNVVDDEDLGTIDGKTEFSSDTVTISIKRSVRDRAEMGVGRDRMTLAHELGHGVMHHGAPKFRHAGAIGATTLSKVSAFESAEHQAKIFAAAFLIHDDAAATLASALDISLEFGVSLQAAEICFDRLAKAAEHAQSAERVQKINREIKAALLGQPKSKQMTYLDDICTSCRKATLVPIDNKVLCDTCGFVGDRYQDGDEAA
jgi:IrrE N-terminal-like domain